MNDIPIPVSIITGFLGAGKTSLLNQIIKKYPAKKFAVIENEFGEIGIDGGLIVGIGENIFELSNGCICCSLNDDFYATLRELLSSKYQFDYLLIETTGIADPDSIIKAFTASESIKKQFRLDSVICLADALHFEAIIDKQPEVRKQLAVADTVLLNKTDAVTSEYSKTLISLLKYLNPMAKVYPVSFANIEQIALLDSYAFSSSELEKQTMNFGRLTFSKQKMESLNSILLKPSTKVYQHEIVSESFIIPGSFKPEAFSFWMDNFLFFNRQTIFRVKGIVSLDGLEQKLVFHAVRDQYLNETTSPWSDEPRFSKLVFIGKNIKRDQIEDSLYQLLQ